MEKNTRLKSLDALRGFDMLFIMGLAGLVVNVCKLFPEGSMTWLSLQMEHVEWDGLRHHDTIFPLFLFIAGISFPFSLANKRAKGWSSSRIVIDIVRRGLILVLLGVVYNGLFKFNFDTLRCASVLGRIGLAWMFSALLFVKFKPKTLAITAIVILVGYWLLLWLVPGGNDTYGFGDNLVGVIDRAICPGKLIYGDEIHGNNWFDPEGLLSTVPAIVTAMLGMFTGLLVRIEPNKMTEKQKIMYMVAGGAVLLGVGVLWNEVFPINKKLWTSSFVCVVAAYSVFMFALFYYLIDVKKIWKHTLFFRVVGMNSITIYLAQRIINFSGINNFFFGGLVEKMPQGWGAVLNSCGYIAVCWFFLYFLYKKKVFLKV